MALGRVINCCGDKIQKEMTTKTLATPEKAHLLSSDEYQMGNTQDPEEMHLDEELLGHSHILALPFEMTAEIFGHFQPIYPRRSRPGLQSLTLLAQVCRQWRDIAMSSPRLWSSLQLDLDPKILPQQLILLRSWLTRSGACPLSIGITYKAAEPGVIAPPINDIVHELISHCQRWQYVELELPFDVLHLIKGEMPWLRLLKIGPNEVPEIQPPRPLRLFDSSPCLGHIVLSRFFQPSTIELRWENCTTLEGLFLYPEECIVILGRTVNIVHFKATIEEGEGTSGTVPILTHLESLVLLSGEAGPNNSQMLLLDALTLPALRVLRVSEPWFTPNPVMSISNLISRSCCHIRELHVAESLYNPWWYLVCLRLYHLQSEGMESLGQVGKVMRGM
ncbi:hypothetical protein B0H14DRAFT_2504509 [Mycena olivaceomarginata]|nr:hypothetical protein B0H14DRAFT_2504509 [Mycena olivaceomarginata]